MPVFGEDLATEVGRRYGAPVQMMHLKHGIFDEASLSVIALDTIREIGRLAGLSLDVRRFRPNVLVSSLRSVPFEEDDWLGGLGVIRRGGRRPSHHRNDARRSLLNGESSIPTQRLLLLK